MRLCLLTIFICLANAVFASQIPENFTIIVPVEHVNFNEEMGGPIGSFVYNDLTERFYVSTYGSNRGIRCFVEPGGDFPAWENDISVADNKLINAAGKSWQCITESMVVRAAGSMDIVNGYFDSNIPIFSLIFGMALNPEPVTVNGINYGANELAIISDHSRALTPEITKRFLTWDLREIGSPSGADPNNFDPNEYSLLSDEFNPDYLPDMANAEFDTGMLMVDQPEYQFRSGYGYTDWNDALNYILSFEDLVNAIGLTTYGIPQSDFNKDYIGTFMPAFSSDGQKLYYVSRDDRGFGVRMFTGIWVTELESGVTKRIFDDTGIDLIEGTVSDRNSVVRCEPAVVPVGLRNLTGYPYADDVDQVLFNGSEVSGNMCGLNCLVDDGSDNPPVYQVIPGERILDFLGVDIYSLEYYGIDKDDSSTWPYNYDPNSDTYEDRSEWPHMTSITSDDEGNIYCFIEDINTVIKYDTDGRLIALNDKIQMELLNRSQGELNEGFMQLKLQTRKVKADYSADEAVMIPQVMFMGTGIDSVVGIDVYPPCDFTRDGKVDINDVEFFAEQIDISNDPNYLPGLEDPNIYDYAMADINGYSSLVSNRSGLVRTIVDEKDVEVFYQFILPGNLNMDNWVDLQDFAIIAANYYDPESKNWASGDFNFDKVVDFSDFMLFVSSWLQYDD